MLRSPDIQPSNDIIAKALGKANNTYVEFVNELANHGIQLEWRYYKDGKTWLAKGIYKRGGIRGGQIEKTVFWLSIWDGFFKVTYFIPEKVRLDVSGFPLEYEVKQMITNSKQMGKLKYFPLTFELYSGELIETIFSLADFMKAR